MDLIQFSLKRKKMLEIFKDSELFTEKGSYWLKREASCSGLKLLNNLAAESSL